MLSTTLRIGAAREAFRIARDVAAGTDGDPAAAAQILAGTINAVAEGIRGAAASLALNPTAIEHLAAQAAPLFTAAQRNEPAGRDEFLALCADLGISRLADLLMAHQPAVAVDLGAPPANDGPPMPTSLNQVVIDTLADHGVDVTPDAAGAVIDRLFALFGGADLPQDVVHVPATPWEIDFAPVPSALHVDTIPEDIRIRYEPELRAMLTSMEMDHACIVHAIFVSEQRLNDLHPARVVLTKADADRLRQAWDGYQDVNHWGPTDDRSARLAVFYPAVRSVIAGPF